ncbi:MBL fold metallo-hydrolase [Thauera sp.]|uniref:MBL fold metallo-hydrolase n=1 Tax=Thauera sp. TaxID=1905334 RepID=UPI0039E67147
MLGRVMPLQFRPIEGLQTGLIGYLLADLAEKAAVVIDPPRGQTELILALSEERGVELKYVLRTHVHAADADTCEELCSRTSACLLAGDELEMAGMPAARLRRAGHGATIPFGAETIDVIGSPGHTHGSLSFLWQDRLFCGDLFDLDCCAPGGGEAEPGRLFDSLVRRVFVLPEETLVFPAHPIEARRVATLEELKMRLAPMMQHGRDTFITGMLARRTTSAAAL